jgi:DNA-binding winged helix-turn-helix (wHTH) protein/tetratricopeptide (TPR) repeat protein
MANAVRQFYEFGPYRIDPDHRQLTRESKPVPLQPKAFDLLLVLVLNSERLVPKDDLMKAVWPGTFVEESNLAQNISVLRKTLGDTVGENRYVVTVPGRGYRFAEKVQVVDEGGTVTEEEDKLIVESHTRSRLVVEEQQVVNALPAKPQRLRWLVLGSLLCVLVVTGAYLYTHRAPKLTEADTIVLADFNNKTGDPVFDDALRQGLSAQLAQSPFLNLLSDSRAAQTLALMGRPKDAPLTPELAREVCQRTASAAVLDGSIAQIGTHYLLTLKAAACSTGDSLASIEAEAIDKDHVLGALGELASKVRSKLGESLASVLKYDVQPSDVTTPSLEALRAYSLAVRAMRSNKPVESVTLFREAIRLDPNFAEAYSGLASNYFNMGEASQAEENGRKAYELRGHVSEREKLSIEMYYAAFVTRNFEEARKSAQAAIQIYPRAWPTMANLGVFDTYLGEYDESLTMSKKVMELAQGSIQVYTNLMIDYLHENRLDEAEAVAREASNHHLDAAFLHETLYQVKFLRRDTAGMQHEAETALAFARDGLDDLMFYYESDTVAYGGEFAKARELTARAVDYTVRGGQKETAAEYEAESAMREALAGNSSAAKQQANRALALSKGRDAMAIAGIALALAGDTAGATRIAVDLEKRFPEDTVMHYNSLPVMRASIALRSGDSTKAIAALTVSTPHELGQAAQQATFVLYPVYLRGLAYLAAKQGIAAAAEFHKVVDHWGLVQNEPIGALAHLGLGRAYVLSGDTSKAQAAYREFFALWKDADSDIPILNQARAEYAKLQ